MTAESLAGAIPILATPFTATGEVDEAAFRRIVDLAIREGAHAVAMFGFASEFYKLADAERETLARVLIEQAAGRVPVIVSITHHSLEIARRQAALAAQAGADALMVLPPFLFGPGAASGMRHVEAILSAVTIPVIVQYAPLQTGASLVATDFAELQRRHSNLTHIKLDLVPAGPMITAITEASAGSLRTLVGYMGLGLPEAVARGAAGSMPTASLAGAFARMHWLLREDPDAGRELHGRLLPLLGFMMQSIEILIACEKHLLLRRGVISSGYCRAPAACLDAFQKQELERCIQSAGQWLAPVA